MTAIEKMNWLRDSAGDQNVLDELEQWLPASTLDEFVEDYMRLYDLKLNSEDDE